MQKQPGRVTLRGMNTKVVAPIALCVGLLGIVGGVAATQAFQPIAKPKTVVQLVQPAAQTVTVTPTTTAPKPAVKTTTVKPAPVQSTQAVAPAPRTVQKAAVVSSDTSSSTSAPAPAPNPAPASTDPAPPQKGNPVGTITYDPNAPEPKTH